MSSLLSCELNACTNVVKRTITVNVSSIRIMMFIQIKSSQEKFCVLVSLKLLGLINCENHCEDHHLSLGEGHHQCSKDVDKQVF
jgi:hypothetical protein